MIKVFKTICIAFFSILCISCETEELADYPKSSEDSEHKIGDEQYESRNFGMLKFTYEDISYSSEFTYDESRKMVLRNELVQQELNRLKENPSLVAVINGDESIDFYDSEEEMQNSINSISKVQSRSYNTNYIASFEMKLWDREKGRKKSGRYITLWGKENQHGWLTGPKRIGIPNLSPSDLNDQISSFSAWCAVKSNPSTNGGISLRNGQYTNIRITLYEYPNYGGRSVVFNELNVNYTSTHRDYLSSFGFNDLTSSIRVDFYKWSMAGDIMSD